MKPRIVVDTNVLISGVLYEKGNEAQVLGLVLDNRAVLLASLDTLTELKEALERPKFRLTPAESLAVFRIILSKSEIIMRLEKAEEECRDHDDQKFVDLASSGRADYLVTGDRDLLVIRHLGKTKILTAGQVIREMRPN